MKTPRKRYTKEFRAEAVKMVLNGGMSGPMLLTIRELYSIIAKYVD